MLSLVEHEKSFITSGPDQTGCFTSFSTIFKSYRDDERLQ